LRIQRGKKRGRRARDKPVSEELIGISEKKKRQEVSRTQGMREGLKVKGDKGGEKKATLLPRAI